MNLISLIIVVLSNLIIYYIFEKSSFKGGLVFRIIVTILVLFFGGIFQLFFEIINEKGLVSIVIPCIVFILYCIIINAIQFLIYNRTRSFISFLIVSEIVASLLSFGVNYLLPTIF